MTAVAAPTNDTDAVPAGLASPEWGGFDPKRARGQDARDHWQAFGTAARLGWQANRLQPDELIGPLSSLLTDVEIWRNPKSKISGSGASEREFDGINRHHYWLIATVR